MKSHTAVPGLLWFLAGLALAARVAAAADSAALPVDEDAFLKQPIDFSPPDEKPLDDRWLQPPASPYPFPRAELSRVGGALRMAVDGEPLGQFARSCWTTTMPGAPLERQLREQGVRLFVIDTDVHARLDAQPNHAFRRFADRADKVLAAVPDAWLLIRVWMLNVAEDFVSRYPGALLAGPTGVTDWGHPYATTHNFRPNFLNDWRRYSGAHLRQLLDAVGQSSYAPRVIGVYVGAMNSGEWWYYKGAGDPTWDYSPTRHDAFRRFLGLKYGGDLPTAIAEAWNVPITPTLLDLPTPAEREVFPPAPCSKVSDYNQVLNLPVTNAARYFSRIIKTASGGRCLAGMEIHANLNTYPVNGTVFLTQLLDCPDLDFLGGPASYDRRLGAPSRHNAALASLDRHGKLWFDEGDFRTHRAYGTAPGAAGEPPPDVSGTLGMLRREFAQATLRHYQTYLMDFAWTWFYDRDLIHAVGELERLDRFIRTTGAERTATVAVVADQESQLYYNYFANPNHLHDHVLDHLGTDWDFYELRDFLDRDVWPRYRLVIFMNVCALSDPERRAIASLKADGRVLLWLHNPGVVNLSRRHADRDADLLALTGLRLTCDQPPSGALLLDAPACHAFLGLDPVGPPVYAGDGAGQYPLVRMQHTSPSDLASPGLGGDLVAPIRCVDPEATVLGKDSAGNAYVAARRLPTWTSVYTATCLLRPDLIRALARLAGCHVYLDTGDVVYASRDSIAVHATAAGTKALRLPRRADVFDLVSRQGLATQAETLALPMSWGETRLLYLGEAAGAQARLAEIDAAAAADRARFVSTASPAPAVPLPFYQQQRLNRPAAPTVGAAGEASRLGPFPLALLMPSAFLYAGPFPATPEARQRIAELAEAAGRDPSQVRRAEDEPPLPADVPERRAGDRYLYLPARRPSRSLEHGFGAWYAGALPGPWLDDYLLDCGEGQSFVVCVYLDCEPGRRVELAFFAKGDSELWVNGARPAGTPGPVGTVIELPRRRNLIMARITNPGGTAGFSWKVLEPGQDLRPGQQATVPARDVTVWLGPSEPARP